MAAFYHQFDRSLGRFVRKEKDLAMDKAVFNKTIDTRVHARPFSKKSTYTGVIWIRRQLKWRAAINIKKVVVYLGYYSDEKEAALAYDRKAIMLGRKTNILKPATA